MHVWLITVGEPLPLAGHDVRLLRTGRLARALAAQGHGVIWWTSAFDHASKTQFPATERDLHPSTGLELVLLEGVRYRRNLSLGRLLNHWQIARDFRRRARRRAEPDLIVCSLPTLELAREATRLGRAHGVPVVLDVRDLWPDIFLQVAPKPLRPAARLLLMPYFGAARRALRAATGIMGVSQGYLDWALARASRAAGPLDAVFPLGYEAPSQASEPPPTAHQALVALGVDPGRKICWFVGSFGRTYDLITVIEAARRLWQVGRRELQFVLSGGGELEATWRTAARDAPNIVFTGWIDRAEIRAMMRLAWVGLAAYAAGAPQGLPNKLFEYLSAGLPVVSSLRGEAEQALRALDCGLTYEAGSGESLAASLTTLLDAPDVHARLARGAATAFGEHFAANLVDARLIEYLERVARSPRAGPALNQGDRG